MNGKIISLLAATIGAIGGYAYYYYVGCLNGTCALSSNAWIMTGYGAFAGVTLAPFITLRKKTPSKE